MGRGLERAGIIVCAVSAFCVGWSTSAPAGVTGSIIIAGYGPEQNLMQELAAAFEKANPGTAIDIKWSRYLKTVDMVKAGEAQITVTGREIPDLDATPIAWDGIAVIVNFSNPVKEVTNRQVIDIFSGKAKRWLDLGGSDSRIEVIHRPLDQNIRTGFLKALGIDAQPDSTEEEWIREDQKTLGAVGGRLNAVSYISLRQAHEALKFGITIRVLIVNGVDPGEPTVKDGRYKIRRPVLLVTAKERDPVTQAFLDFARSPEGQRIVDELYVSYTP